jgi:hypothetical protein
MNGIKTNRNVLISDFNPFGLDKLVRIVAAVVSVALSLTESPVVEIGVVTIHSRAFNRTLSA